MKTIVTHHNPDLDAIASVWLIKRFMQGWEGAEVIFVPAGETYQGERVDSNMEIIHVDTGLGMFDHHNTDNDTCAAGLVWDYLKKQREEKSKDEFPGAVYKYSLDDDSLTVNEKYHTLSLALERLIKIVNEVDHFREVFWENPEADYYDFMLERIIDGWKIMYPNENLRFLQWGMDCLDAVLTTFKNKVWAESEITKGLNFMTIWGEGIACETVNDEIIHLAQKKGYKIVIRKDSRKGYIRIKSLPLKNIDLTMLYNICKEKDPSASWFLHASRHMILNGSSKNPSNIASKLTLNEIVAIIQNLK